MTVITSLREWLADKLSEQLPEWRFVPHMGALDTPSRTTVVIGQSGIKPLDAAPRDWLLFEYTLTLITRHEDIPKAEDALDAAALELIAALRHIPGIDFQDARPVSWGDRLAYDLKITADRPLTTTRED